MRQSLSHMTPEERAERKRIQTRERVRRLRAPEKAKRQKEKSMQLLAKQARDARPVAAMTPDLEAFVDELITLPLGQAALAMDAWAQDNKCRFPHVEKPIWEPGMTPADFDKLQTRWRRAGLIRHFSIGAIKTDAARKKMKAFKNREKAEAAALGITVAAYQKQKQIRRAEAKK